jgi:hypothetical protein
LSETYNAPGKPNQISENFQTKNWRSSVPVSVHTGIVVLLQLDLVPATQAIARTLLDLTP